MTTRRDDTSLTTRDPRENLGARMNPTPEPIAAEPRNRPRGRTASLGLGAKALAKLRATSASTIFYWAVALFATAPAWIVRHPPLQDMPFHIATIRVIHDWNDPALHFTDFYQLNLRTSYIGYYLVGSFLAFFLGAYKANVVLVSAYLGGTPLALRELLRALKKDERLCLFALPLVVNVMFMYGLLPFVIGFPVMFLAMAWTVRHVEHPTRKTGITLAVLGVVLFFAHVLPFFLFGVAYILFFPWLRPSRWIRVAAPGVPSALLAGWWFLGSPAGAAAEHGHASGGIFKSLPLDTSFSQILQWSTNVFTDQSDEKWLLLCVIAAIVGIGLSQGEKDSSSPLSRRYFFVVIVCIAGFVSLADHLGDVWLLAQRFPVPGLLCAIPLLRIPRNPVRGAVATAAVLAVCAGSILNTCRHFIKFELEEVGDFDGAIAAMEPGKKVCGLIYDKYSHVVPNAVFLHFVSYYQAEKGGLVMFSYAGFPHWPFQYKPGHFPPPGGPPRLRWEWTPEATPIREIYPFYDYVLERGSGFRPPPGTYHRIYARDRWQVWERD
jgi:hypothetical protein